VQNEGANLNASVAAWIGRAASRPSLRDSVGAAGPPSPRSGFGAASREAEFKLQGRSHDRTARLYASRARRPDGCAHRRCRRIGAKIGRFLIDTARD